MKLFNKSDQGGFVPLTIPKDTEPTIRTIERLAVLLTDEDLLKHEEVKQALIKTMVSVCQAQSMQCTTGFIISSGEL